MNVKCNINSDFLKFLKVCDTLNMKRFKKKKEREREREREKTPEKANMLPAIILRAQSDIKFKAPVDALTRG